MRLGRKATFCPRTTVRSSIAEYLICGDNEKLMVWGGHTCIWGRSKRWFGLHQQIVFVVCCMTSLRYHTWGNAAPPGQQRRKEMQHLHVQPCKLGHRPVLVQSTFGFIIVWKIDIRVPVVLHPQSSAWWLPFSKQSTCKNTPPAFHTLQNSHTRVRL